MSISNRPGIGYVIEDGGASFMSRVVGNAGVNITQSVITSIAVKVFDVDSDTPDTATYSATLTVSAVVFDTLQTDARWTEDATGYNFRHDMPASAFPTGEHKYRVEYKFTPATGEVFWVLFDVTATNVRTS
jgi:hypothetical protein